MAKRRTIRDNPLDAIAPASTAGQGDEPSAETKFRSAGRVSATKTLKQRGPLQSRPILRTPRLPLPIPSEQHLRLKAISSGE